jgi:hypothetical protein
VQYSRGGNYPGGIDHIASGTLSENFIPYPSISMGPMYIWGHYDGTCDHKGGSSGTVYHYC